MLWVVIKLRNFNTFQFFGSRIGQIKKDRGAFANLHNQSNQNFNSQVSFRMTCWWNAEMCMQPSRFWQFSRSSVKQRSQFHHCKNSESSFLRWRKLRPRFADDLENCQSCRTRFWQFSRSSAKHSPSFRHRKKLDTSTKLIKRLPSSERINWVKVKVRKFDVTTMFGTSIILQPLIQQEELMAIPINCHFIMILQRLIILKKTNVKKIYVRRKSLHFWQQYHPRLPTHPTLMFLSPRWNPTKKIS